MNYRIVVFSILYLVTISCCKINKGVIHQDLNKYDQAFLIITNNRAKTKDGFNTKILSKVTVSEEKINFSIFHPFFLDTLKTYPNLDKPNLLFDFKNTIIEEDSSLSTLSTKKQSKTFLFFSNEREEFFFAELFLSSKKGIFKYDERPYFGKSFLYLFRVENSKVKLVKTKEIAYN